MERLKELYEYREMIIGLVKKDLRGRYKGSVLGFLWTFINPLMQLMVFTMVFSVILRSDIEKYYLFLFVALIPWNFFSGCLSGGARAVLNEQSLVTKIYFPREVLPVSYVTSGFINMLYCFIVVFIVVIFSGISIYPPALLCLVPVMIIEYFMALGVALFTSAVTVYLRDFEHIMGVVGMAWQYLTPVMYPTTWVPDRLMPVFNLNPMTHIITAYRDILYYGKVPNMSTLAVSALFAAVILLIGSAVFGRLKIRFAEEM
ncbi:MAG: ABC transporter permease [Oscillospiraceae bacterium]|nr:ABC transporter permease [Oscillospiraceae bacterium]